MHLKPFATPFSFCLAFFMSFLGFTLMFHFDHGGLLLEVPNTHCHEFCACSCSQNNRHQEIMTSLALAYDDIDDISYDIVKWSSSCLLE